MSVLDFYYYQKLIIENCVVLKKTIGEWVYHNLIYVSIFFRGSTSAFIYCILVKSIRFFDKIYYNCWIWI